MAMNIMNTSHDQGVERFLALTKGIKFCMLTTVEQSGAPHSRPMTIQQIGEKAELWFFTGKATGLASAILNNDEVTATFSNERGDAFVSVFGRARLLVDRRKMEELWEPIYQTWFPKGILDPNLALVRIDVELAEHWDSGCGILTTLFHRGEPPRTGSFSDQTNGPSAKRHC